MEIASKTQKIKQLTEMALFTRTPNDLLTAHGMEKIRPTDELLQEFGRLLYDGKPMTMHKYIKLMNGRNAPTLAEARVLSWYFGIPLDGLCSIEIPREIGDLRKERAKIS